MLCIPPILNLCLPTDVSYVPTVEKRLTCSDNVWMESREIIYARSIRDLTFAAFRLDRSQENFTTYRKYRNRGEITFLEFS